MAAFEEVKAAAALFDTEPEKSTAMKIVHKLSNSELATWKPDDMEVLESCLVDENQHACVAFVAAMTRLRELYDKSPGNA